MMDDTLTLPTAERLIEAAIAAPSVHTSQPWQFVARPADRVIEIYADPAGPDLQRVAGTNVIGKLLPMRDFPSRPGGRSRSPAGEPGPRLAVVSTSAGDRASWLRAGQAAQRVLLLAAHHRVRADLLSAAPEAPAAPAYPGTGLAGEHPAVILQFGSGQLRPAPARRPVAQVLRVLSPVAV
jgi:nitroreductase